MTGGLLLKLQIYGNVDPHPCKRVLYDRWSFIAMVLTHSFNIPIHKCTVISNQSFVCTFIHRYVEITELASFLCYMAHNDDDVHLISLHFNIDSI